MYRDKRVCIVVPAFDEEKLITRTLGTLPSWVDDVVVVDDCSRDATADVVREISERDARVHLVRHETKFARY